MTVYYFNVEGGGTCIFFIKVFPIVKKVNKLKWIIQWNIDNFLVLPYHLWVIIIKSI